MLKRIQIENFRGFRELTLTQDLNPVTVLLGPNSSGKTTVLHAIRLACQAMDLALNSDSPARVVGNHIEVTSDTLIDAPAQLLPLADWQALFVDQKVSANTKFSIALAFDDVDAIQRLQLVMGYARNNQLKFSLTVQAPAAVELVSGLPKKSSKVSTLLSEWLQSHAPKAVFIPPFYGVVKDEEYRQRVVVDRLVGSGDQSHVVRNLITGLEPHQLTQMNSFLSELMGVTISYRTTGDKIETESPLRAEFKDTNGAIEISAAGAGLVNLVALYASLARWQTSAKAGLVMFLLDEPEAHLHPRLQGETALRLASLVTQEFGAQLFMATHSVEIINRLGEHPGAKLLRTDRTATPSVTVLDGQQQVLGELSQWADLTPFTSINFMASRRVLFHEGTSDDVILHRCAELRFRQLPIKRKQFERWAMVPLHGSGNEKTVDLLRRLLRSKVWSQQADGSAFKLAIVLDRDHSRNPGFEVKNEAEQPQSASLVWGQHSIESLFMSPLVLSYWIRAFAGSCAPANLEALIAQAIASADQDTKLQEETVDQLMLNFFKQPLQDTKGNDLALNTDRHRSRAMVLARELYASQPAVYQRGKDRAEFVLGQIKPHLLLPKRNSFPVDVSKLVSRADLNLVSDPVAAIPVEIESLLGWMVDSV